MHLYGRANKARCSCWADEMLTPNLVLGIDWTPRRDVIVFKNLRFRLSPQVQRNGIVKNLHSVKRFWKDVFSVTVLSAKFWYFDMYSATEGDRLREVVANEDSALFYVFTDELHIAGAITVQPNEPRPPRQNFETNFEISQSHVEIWTMRLRTLVLSST